MGITLQQVLTRPDPFMSFRWVARSVPFASLGPIDPSYIESFEIPWGNVKSDGVFFGGGYNYFPGFHDTSAFSVTFYGDSEGRVLKYIWGWKNKVKDMKTGLYGLPPDYKEEWQIALLNARGDEVSAFKFSGCWPTDTNQISLSSDSSERIIINQSFSVDNVELM